MTTPIAAGPLDRKVRAQAVAWIRRHKNDDPRDGHLYIDTNKEDADKWGAQYKPGFAWLEPLYTESSVIKEVDFVRSQVAKWLAVVQPTLRDEFVKEFIRSNVLADRREPIGEASSPKGDGRAAG